MLVATGSDAKMLPGLKPDDRILTNVEILNMDRIPKSLVVIGAGAVGVEFGSIFKSFGAEVTIVEYLPRVVPNEDEDVSKELSRVLDARLAPVEFQDGQHVLEPGTAGDPPPDLRFAHPGQPGQRGADEFART